jgi:hypothetical protein
LTYYRLNYPIPQPAPDIRTLDMGGLHGNPRRANICVDYYYTQQYPSKSHYIHQTTQPNYLLDEVVAWVQQPPNALARQIR